MIEKVSITRLNFDEFEVLIKCQSFHLSKAHRDQINRLKFVHTILEFQKLKQ